MNVIKFDGTKVLKKLFQQNESIEIIYFEMAEYAMSMLYKYFPFNSLFEGASWKNKPNECFQSTLLVWADCFMTWQMNDLEKIKDALNNCRDKNIIPSLGLFKLIYEGDRDAVIHAEIDQYITYLYKNSEYTGHIRTIKSGTLTIDEWLGLTKL